MDGISTPPDDGPALLRAILESPADDAPRLVYADWLEDHGYGQAGEFIRTSCRHGLPPTTSTLGKEFESPMAAMAVLDPGLFKSASIQRAWWKRGFPADISITCKHFFEFAPAIFSAWPVEEVEVTDRRPKFDDDRALWLWMRGSAARVPTKWPSDLRFAWVLPDQLYTAMVGDEDASEEVPFGTEAEALAFLKAACVRLGRQLAGLPPLD